MTSEEFRNLKHGDKIAGPDGVNFIVHNNYRQGTGLVVAVRTIVIYGRYCGDFTVSKRHKLINLTMPDGTYEVQVVRRID